MTYSTPEQLRFPPVAGLTSRGDFEGGALSSNFGPLHPQTFQDRRTGGPIQGPYQTALAQQLPGQGPPASGHRNPVSGPRAGLEYLLRTSTNSQRRRRHRLAFPPGTVPFRPSPPFRPRTVLPSPCDRDKDREVHQKCSRQARRLVRLRRVSAALGLSSQVYETFGVSGEFKKDLKKMLTK